MPKYDTTFKEAWLDAKDGNNHPIRGWLEQRQGSNPTVVYCFLCKKEFDVKNGGMSQLLQHAKGKNHSTVAKAALDPRQARFQTTIADNNIQIGLTNAPQCWNPSHADKVSSAEITWCLQVGTYGYSYNSCDSIGPAFKKTFSDSLVVKDVCISSRKVSYSIANGLGPFFLKELISDLSTSFYTLVMDEATNDAGKKQLDFHLRFWDEGREQVRCNFLCAFEMGHATADILLEKGKSVIIHNNLRPEKLLMVGSDGPAVNLKLLRLIDEYVKDAGSKGLVDIGTCNLHIIHNSFGKGMKSLPEWKIEDFLDVLFKWFYHYPSRQEDFQSIQTQLQQCELVILRYGSNRWLSIVPVIKRVLEVYGSLQEYFNNFVPTNLKTALKSEMYKVIKRIIDDPLTKPRLFFLVSVGENYNVILTLLQKSSPLIHILYDEIVSLIKLLLIKIFQPSIVGDLDGPKLKTFDVTRESPNILMNSKIDVGNTRTELNKVKELHRLQFYKDCKEFLLATTKYLIDKCPLNNRLLRYVGCLHPDLQKEYSGVNAIINVAKAIPNVIKLNELDALKRECHLYMSEETSENPSQGIGGPF